MGVERPQTVSVYLEGEEDTPMAHRQASLVRDIARERLGLEVLRPGQEETIVSILEGRDTLTVMPTGYGESAIYQISAVVLRGPTVVISPLLALQRDQPDQFYRAGDGAAGGF
jgi:ATP-dependent DNA helicase RecQ